MKPLPLERQRLLKSLIAARIRGRVPKARIAHLAGVSRTTIGRLERGEQFPTPTMLRAYAELCGLDAPQLLLSWGIVPAEVLTRLQQNPHLVTLVMGG